MKFVMMFLLFLFALVPQVSAQKNGTSVRFNGNGTKTVNPPGAFNRFTVPTHHGNNGVNGFNNHNHNGVRGFNNVHHHNNFQNGFGVTRPFAINGYNGYSYAPPIAIAPQGIPIVSSGYSAYSYNSYGGAAYGGLTPQEAQAAIAAAAAAKAQATGYQVQGVGFANPGFGRAILGY